LAKSVYIVNGTQSALLLAV